MLSKRAKIQRYLVVGLTTAAVYYGIINMGAMFTSLPIWSVSVFSFTLAVLFQYVLHSKLTFQKQAADRQQFTRFVITVIMGYALSTIITGFLGPTLNVPVALTSAAVIVLLPISNFILFQLWVFKGRA